MRRVRIKENIGGARGRVAFRLCATLDGGPIYCRLGSIHHNNLRPLYTGIIMLSRSESGQPMPGYSSKFEEVKLVSSDYTLVAYEIQEVVMSNYPFDLTSTFPQDQTGHSNLSRSL
jgi:hypothetical protein